MIRPAIPPFHPGTPPAVSGRWLSNGRYRVLLTPYGTGVSECGNLRLTAWCGDRTTDGEGFHLWIRDGDDPAWRVGSPAAPAAGARRDDGVVALHGRHDGLDWRLAVAVLPEADAEIRRLTLINTTGRTRRLTVTGVAEVVLHQARAHAAHPVFSRLFLQTDVEPARNLLVATRRPRSPEEIYPVLFAAMRGGGNWRFETDRSRMIGRRLPGEGPRFAAAPEALAGGAGNVLDPVLGQAVTLTLEPSAEATVDLLLGAADDREGARGLAEALALPGRVVAWLDGAREAEERRRSTLELSRDEADRAEAMAAAMAFGVTSLADPDAAADGAVDLGAFDLDDNRWLALLDGGSSPPAGEDFARLSRWWASSGLPIDSLVLRDESDDAAPRRVRTSADERRALRQRAALVVTGRVPELAGPPLATDERVATTAAAAPSAATAREPLLFDNGYGGFASGGREFVIRFERRPGGGYRRTPLPWTNVLANEEFGCIVSESGAGATWSRNSREYRLTPWANDPNLDPAGECFYVRDEVTGAFGSPLPGPAPWPADYEVRHAPGVTRAFVAADGLEVATTIRVARHDPVRFTRLSLTETAGRARRLAIHATARLVLGHAPEDSARYVSTAPGPRPGSLLATTRRGGDVTGRVAFAGLATSGGEVDRSIGGDRATFLGTHRTAAAPRALIDGGPLDGVTGAGLDPMFAQRVVIDLPANGTAEVAFVLGDAASAAEAGAYLDRYATLAALDVAAGQADRWWADELGGLSIDSPSPALDLMVNHWLPYQTVACRLWGRSAFYQSGGAFGFRDQLQDALSLLMLRPEIAREQILRNAAHQFPEGDVLHWWHPPAGAGIRTRFADDRLWLPGLTAQYVAATGDEALLDVPVTWVESRALEDGEDEAFLRAGRTERADTVYEHCLRAIECSLDVGEHGLPLFGTGDWNDGMNRVGREGKGESVWMGFFLYQVLGDFLPLCERRGDAGRALRYRHHRERLRDALNDGGWDGAWYRRGYYDNGTPLGSAGGDECRIDALAQAWAVLSGAAPPDRASEAMDNCAAWLVSEDERLIRLLTPPFEKTIEDPGYIKGYVAGVRENGGQYTHAALWVVRAMAELGRNDVAARWLDLLNPVLHAATPEAVERYQVEPYVVAADVYGVAPHVGRGGWTWYTGSAGWMYRVAVESILGLQWRDGNRLVIKPCLPDDWPAATIRWRPPGGLTRYVITLDNPRRAGLGAYCGTVDGLELAVIDGAAQLELATDGLEHHVRIETGAASPAAVPAR